MGSAGSEWVVFYGTVADLNEYADRSLQIWEYFLAYSTITSRQGGASCYQITLVKNINSTHRIEGVFNQFGLKGALGAAQARRSA